MKSVAVFCGSAMGNSPRYRSVAEALGRAIAQRGLTLVYGGASVGLMGALADAAIGAGGRVIGVIPAALVSRELAHEGLADLRIVADMLERKSLMAALADAFLALPGGVGTLDELFEMLTWSTLGLHDKPCLLLDVDDYFAPLLAFLDGAVDAGFLKPRWRARLRVFTEVDLLLDRGLGARSEA